MKVTLNFDEQDRNYVRSLYRKQVKAHPGIDREVLWGKLSSRYEEFAKAHPATAARAIFDWVDEVETRSGEIIEDDQGEFDFQEGTIFALNKTRIVKEDMVADHWRQKRQQIIANQDRANAAAAKAINICNRHIDELLGGKAA